MIRNRLERMLRPKSIAVIGGGAFGTNVVKQSLKMGFAGEIWPVHPTKDDVEGVKAYRTIAELPGSPDATFIGVNRNLTIEMVTAAAGIATRAARPVSRPASSRLAIMTRTASGCRRS